jgi:hypothetical protein
MPNFPVPDPSRAISSTVNALIVTNQRRREAQAQLQRQEALQEERRTLQKQAEQRKLLDMNLQNNIPIDPMAFPDINSNELAQYKNVLKIKQQRDKIAGEVGPLAQQLQAVGQASGSGISARPEQPNLAMQEQVGNLIQQILLKQQETGDPITRQRIREAAASATSGAKIAKEKAFQDAMRAERKETRTRRAIQRKGMEEQAVDDFATEMAFKEEHIPGLTPLEPFIQRGQRLGFGLTKATELAIRADEEARVKQLKRADALRSAQGIPDRAYIEATQRDWQARFPGETVTFDDALLITKNDRMVDPFFAKRGQFVLVPIANAADARRFREVRQNQESLLHASALMRKKFFALRNAVEEGRVTAGPGLTDTFFDAMNFVGMQPAEVAGYRTASFQWVAAFLKATQGARPSDFDLRMFMALVPSLTEVLAESGPEKLNVLEESMLNAMRVVGDPRFSQDIEAIKRFGRTPLEKELEGKADRLRIRFEEGELTPDNFMDDGEMKDFLKKMNEFSTSERAQKFILPGYDVRAPTLRPAIQKALDEALGAQ